MYPHRIRLRGPWECEPLARVPGGPAPLPPPLRMPLPNRWAEGGLADFAGRVRFRRRFGYPGRIDPTERVWLTFAGVTDRAEVTLNGTSLGRSHAASGPFEFEVTPLLLPRNELVVDVEGTAEGGGLWGEVALEVRRTAFLRGVRFWAAGTGDETELHAAGEVVGTAERPLDLYLLLGRSTAAYATVTPAPEARPFHLASDKLSGEQRRGEGGGPAAVRVDLVDGATVWYTVGREFIFEPASGPGG